MAGFYMDAPSDRIAWDRDGSILTLVSDGGGVTAQNATARRAVNDESDVGLTLPPGGVRRVAVVFPLPMDCAAVFIALSTASTVTVETSKDTTTGLDGTWNSQFLVGLNALGVVKPRYRMTEHLLALQPNATSSDLRGVRFTGTSQVIPGGSVVRAFHVYGAPSALATKDRLALWHPTSDVKLPTTWFDWGDVPRSTSADRSFRVKNLSEDLVATDVDVYVEALTPGVPSVAAMHTLSENGGATFQTGLNLPALDPGEISDELIVRRVVPANALVSTWSARIAADVNQWEEYTP